MKIYFFITLVVISFFVGFYVSADEMPSYLKDATIVVTLKNGKQYEFSANQWKVVPRVDKKPATPVTHATQTAVTEKEEKKNRIKVLGGVGPTGLNTEINGSVTTVTPTKGMVQGVGYERKVTDKLSVGGEALSNGTYTLDLGVDF